MRILKQIIGWTIVAAGTPVILVGIILVGLSIPVFMFAYGLIDPLEAEWSA